MACSVTVTNGTLDQKEIDAYIARATQKIRCGAASYRHQRLRRRSGTELRPAASAPSTASAASRAILVGTLDRFNNAKRAEEHDRVKHSLS